MEFNITPSRLDYKAIILVVAACGWSDVLEYFLAPKRRPCGLDLQNALDTALHNVTKRYYTSTIRVLLDLGADPNFRGLFRRTVLHNAAKRGYDEFMRLLLDREVNIRAIDESDKTPLHLAGDKGNEAVFLVMHLHLHGNLLHVRREEGKKQLLLIE